MESIEMEPKYIWGPRKWRELHQKALNYRSCNAIFFIRWLESFINSLPCWTCQYHFRELVEINPVYLYLRNRETLFYWTYIMHDQVNARLGKYSPPYVVARSIYH